jgi:8-oxo-dGTP pyrophosphatase MutT (NUDIX family)
VIEQYKSCGAIILHKGKVLLMRHGRSRIWEFPKTPVDEGETEEQTAIRALKQEADLDITIVPGFRHVLRHVYRSRSNRVEKDTVLFLATVQEVKKIPQTEEEATCKWLRPFEAVKKITFDEVKDALEAALEAA